MLNRDCSCLIEEFKDSLFHFFEEEPPEGFVTMGAILKLKMMAAEQETILLRFTDIIQNFDTKKSDFSLYYNITGTFILPMTNGR